MLAAADMDGDGSLDIVGVCEGGLGIIDNGGPPIPDLRFQPDRVTMRWAPQSFVTRYDVIRGNLATLRATGGNFGAAILACLKNDAAQAWAVDPLTPPRGGGIFYLSRAIQPNGHPATYDSGGAGQAHPRDPLIAAAQLACP